MFSYSEKCELIFSTNANPSKLESVSFNVSSILGSSITWSYTVYDSILLDTANLLLGIRRTLHHPQSFQYITPQK